MLNDAMFFMGGVATGWLSMAGVIWVIIWRDDQRYKDDE